MMNRRAFFAMLASAAAGAAFDPERALWVPGRKVISIPPEHGFEVDHVGFYDTSNRGWIQRVQITNSPETFPLSTSLGSVELARSNRVSLAGAIVFLRKNLPDEYFRIALRQISAMQTGPSLVQMSADSKTGPCLYAWRWEPIQLFSPPSRTLRLR